MKTPYIPSLDGIRALAVLLVFFSHTLTFIPGMLGVTIFFFLSGYLITTLLRLEFTSTRKVDFQRFYLKRTIRILPPLYLLLCISMALQVFHVLGALHPPAFLAESLFFTNYWIILNKRGLGPGLDVLWSLAVEEHFYLLFPILYAVIADRFDARRQGIILSSMCGLILGWRFVLHYGLHCSVARTRLGTDTRIDSILFGCVMAIIANPITKDVLAEKISKQLLWLLPFALAELLFGAFWHNTGFRETIRYSLDGVAIFVCFNFAINAKNSLGFRFLNWGPLVFLGRISYGFYLIHYIIIELLNTHLHVSLAMRIAVSLLLAIAIASASFYAVDRPLARWRARITARMPATVGL